MGHGSVRQGLLTMVFTGLCSLLGSRLFLTALQVYLKYSYLLFIYIIGSPWTICSKIGVHLYICFRISIIFVTFNLTFRHCHSNAKYNLHR